MLKVLSLNSVSVGISFVLGIFSSKLISVFLGPSGMALLGNFRNFSSMAKSIGTLGINNAVIKLVVENKGDRKTLSAIYSTFFWWYLLVSVTLAIVVFVAADTVSALLFFSNRYSFPVRLFGMLLPLMAINAFWLAIFNSWGKFKIIIVIQIISNVLIFAATALLIWQHQLAGGLFAIGLGEFLLFLVTFVFIRIDNKHFDFNLTMTCQRVYLKTMGKFSTMALLSAVLVPVTLILIRNQIVAQSSIAQAGIWDALGRLSGFYMLLVNSGLSLYYMPKLAALKTDLEFRKELVYFFRLLVPVFAAMLVVIYIFKGVILNLAFTNDFAAIKSLLVWQLIGDFLKMATLAFGFQILVKTRIRDYFIVELVFNLSYLLLCFLWIGQGGVEAALQAYCLSAGISLLVVLWMFRNTLFGKYHS